MLQLIGYYYSMDHLLFNIFPLSLTFTCWTPLNERKIYILIFATYLEYQKTNSNLLLHTWLHIEIKIRYLLFTTNNLGISHPVDTDLRRKLTYFLCGQTFSTLMYKYSFIRKSVIKSFWLLPRNETFVYRMFANICKQKALG